jgi:hypothetical protein
LRGNTKLSKQIHTRKPAKNPEKGKNSEQCANNEVYETEKHRAAIDMEWVPVINIILYIFAFSQVTITGSFIVVATFRSSYTKRKRRKHSDGKKKQVVVRNLSYALAQRTIF